MSNTQHAPSPAPITSPTGTPKVGIIMGSQSDWATMSLSAQILADFGIPFECQVVSAHRTPDKLFDYAKTAKDKGLKSHHRRGRRSGSSAWYVCQPNPIACAWRTRQIKHTVRLGQFIIHRTNAQRRGGRYACHWRCWCVQCWTAGNTDTCHR